MKKPVAQKCEPIIALGAMTFGGQTSAADAGRMIHMFLDEGHTWIDTAYIYTDGRSERILGRILRGTIRRKVFLATKVHPGSLTGLKKDGLTPAAIRRKVETSLRRLRADRVDLLYLHSPDNRTPLEDSLGACQALIEQGKIGEIGLSNYAAWQVAEAVSICLQNGWTPPMIYQGMYNAITRDVERECIPACRHFGMDFIAYNPLAGGLLTGKHLHVSDEPATGRFTNPYYLDRYWTRLHFEAVDLLRAAARRSRIPLTAAAIRWLVHHGMADGILLGASRLEHLRENLAACRQRPLSPAFCQAFDRAWEIIRPACQRYFRD